LFAEKRPSAIIDVTGLRDAASAYFSMLTPFSMRETPRLRIDLNRV